MIRMGEEDIKKVQLNLLDVIHNYCEENNIKYFLGYGTLIGAVRHQGYIPWDDDIDLCMLRKDYEIFVKNFNNYSADYKVYTPYLCEKFCYPFAKVCDEKTLYVEETYGMMPELGVTVDLFPIDDLPENSQRRGNLIERQNRLRKLMNLHSISVKNRGIVKKILLYILRTVLQLFNFNKLAIKMDKLTKSCYGCESEFCGNIIWGYREREVVKKQIYGSQDELKFEGKDRKVPIGYDELLHSIYGDYMKLPPEGQRIPHHYFQAYYK